MALKFPRNAQLWLPDYLRSRLRRETVPAGTAMHVLLCVADHFEPDHGRASSDTERARVARWRRDYPTLAASFRDADGRPPQHTFFFPAEAYRAEHLEVLAELCAQGLGEVEVHLHHGHDTSASLRARLEEFTATLAGRHGLLSRHPDGRPAYAFIHGDWALDNGGLDSSTCGVNDELTILRQTGCYADLTMPAVPDPAQSRVVNRLYHVTDDPTRPRSYDQGVAARVGQRPPDDSLLLIEGPLTVWWSSRSVLPRIDCGALDATPGNHPTAERMARWINASVTVQGRPEWVFVKVHTHGAPERNADVLLGRTMADFHHDIGQLFNDGVHYRLHYVTAREMYNIACAAEKGHAGDPSAYRDFAIRRSDDVGTVGHERDAG